MTNNVQNVSFHQRKQKLATYVQKSSIMRLLSICLCTGLLFCSAYCTDNQNSVFAEESVTEKQTSFTADKKFHFEENESGITIRGYCGNSSEKKVVIPETINGKPVTTIHSLAFCVHNMESVVIPNGVTTIEEGAFNSCRFLQSVIIPNSVTTIGERAFQYCSALESVVIPNGVTTIEAGVFDGCKSLQSVIIPNSVTTIGAFAFNGCESLQTVDIPNRVITIEEGAFEDCQSLQSVTISNSVTTIGEGAFAGCQNLELWKISPDNPNYKSDGAVLLSKDGKTLVACPVAAASEKFTIPNGVTTIGGKAFAGSERVMSSLKSVAIPDSVTTIEKKAFYCCCSLTSINISKNVMTIGGGIFAGCIALKSLQVSPDNPNYKNDGAVLLSKDGKTLVACPTASEKFTIPNGVTTIEEGAFALCPFLKFIVIPDSVTTIEEGAFAWCHLQSIDIPKSVTTIKAETFMGCYSLKSIVIPDSITTIEARAFDSCESLQSVVIPDSVTIIGKDAFARCSVHLIIQTPKGSKAEEYVKGNNIGTKEISEEVNEPKTDDKNSGHETDIEQFKFADNETGISITKYIGEEKQVVIPAIINGKPVTTIDSGAFSYCKSLRSVVIPDSVITIEEGVFAGCKSLKSIVIPSHVATIGFAAFCRCEAFESIVIPDSVTTVGPGAFVGCNALKSLQVSPDNPNYKSDGMCLLSKDGKKFIACPTASGKFTIPNGITTIEAGAFTFCLSLESVIIPDSVITIEEAAFAGCESLKSVVIPESVTTIEKEVFVQCSKNLIIRTPKGSKAEEYAKENGYKVRELKPQK